jgi:hypothetical protein
MLAKNTRASVATVTIALITGLLGALWVALMPAPAQAQPGDILHLLSIKVDDYQDGWPDNADEPYIEVHGNNVWDAGNSGGSMGAGDTRTIDVSVPISGAGVSVQLWEADGGRRHPTNPDDLLGEFVAEYTDGTEKTSTIAVDHDYRYEITYRVERPPVVDADPPETVISSGPQGTVFSNQATFEFHADEPSTFQCKLDGGVFEPCSSPKVYTSLASGGHNFEVKAIDGAGNVDPSPASRSWTAQQNTAPTIGVPKPAPGSAVRNRTPLISAVVRDAETELTQGNITLKVDGNVKSFAYDAVGDMLLRQSNKLPFGKHTVSITASDGQASNTETWSFQVVR